jgi:hypothetical protein
MNGKRRKVFSVDPRDATVEGLLYKQGEVFPVLDYACYDYAMKTYGGVKV